MPAFIEGEFVDTPTESDGELDIIPASQNYFLVLRSMLFAGMLKWGCYLKNQKNSSASFGLRTPFSLEYLALKAWFNSEFWCEYMYSYFRSQTLWDQMLYRITPNFASTALDQMVKTVNVSMAQIIRNSFEELGGKLKSAVEVLPKNIRDHYTHGVLSVSSLKLLNEPTLVPQVCHAADIMFGEAEAEEHGFIHVLEYMNFSKVEDYNYRLKIFIFKK